MADTWLRICRDFIDYEIESFDSQDSAWPWDDMRRYELQFRGGKAAGSDAELIILDMGAAKELNLFTLYNVNFPSYAILGNASADFSSPSYDSGAITVSQDKVTGRYKSIVDPQDYAAFDYRYVALEIPSGTPLDGSTQHFVGSLALSEDAELLIGNTSPGLTFTPRHSRQAVDMLSGAPRTVRRGPRLVELGFTRSVLRTSEYWAQVAKFFLSIDSDNVVILAFNGLLVESGEANSEYFYFMKSLDDASYSIQNRAQADLSSIRLKEVS